MIPTLQLPDLSHAIPRTLAPFRSDAPAGRLARRLFDAKIIPATAPAQAGRQPHSAAQRYLEAWAKEQLGELKLFPVLFQIELGPKLDEHLEPMPGTVCGQFRWFTERFACEVGPALEALEAAHEGLGQTTLTAIDMASPHLIPAFTPWDTMGMAQNLYWHGEADESYLLEVEYETEAEREEARQEIVTRQVVDLNFPAWATEWPAKRKRLSRERLRTLAASARSTRVRSVSNLVARLRRLKFGDEFVQRTQGNFVGYGPVLFWRHRDLTERVFDDYINYSYECEFVEACGEYEIDLEVETGVAVWMKLLKARFEGIRLLDALMAELAEGDWKRIPRGLR